MRYTHKLIQLCIFVVSIEYVHVKVGKKAKITKFLLSTKTKLSFRVGIPD